MAQILKFISDVLVLDNNSSDSIMEKSSDYLGFSTDPEILKHFDPDERVLFSDKLYKYNPYGWKQERNILISNKFVYNLKKKTLKRKINLHKITAITFSEHKESQEFVLHVPSEYDYRYTSLKY